MREKFSSEDSKYLEDRKKLAELMGPQDLWLTMNHWQLYCGLGNLSRSLQIYELVKSTLSVPGHIAEFGCWKGANLLYMAKILKIFDPMGQKQVLGFDSFEGLTQFNEHDLSALGFKGQYKGDALELEAFITLYGLQDDVILTKGYIEDTLPELINANPYLRFSLVYCDTDLYSSTALILKLLHNKLSIGGLFVLDEWNMQDFPGETQAVSEFLEVYGNHYQMLSVQHARQPSLVLKKISN